MRIKVFEPTLGGSLPTYLPRRIMKLSVTDQGLAVVPATIGLVRFERLIALMVMKPQELGGDVPAFLLFLRDQARPLLVPPAALHHESFPNVGAKTLLDRIRQQALFLCQKAGELRVDRQTADFLKGRPLVSREHSTDQLAMGVAEALSKAGLVVELPDVQLPDRQSSSAPTPPVENVPEPAVSLPTREAQTVPISSHSAEQAGSRAQPLVSSEPIAASQTVASESRATLKKPDSSFEEGFEVEEPPTPSLIKRIDPDSPVSIWSQLLYPFRGRASAVLMICWASLSVFMIWQINQDVIDMMGEANSEYLKQIVWVLPVLLYFLGACAGGVIRSTVSGQESLEDLPDLLALPSRGREALALGLSFIFSGLFELVILLLFSSLLLQDGFISGLGLLVIRLAGASLSIVAFVSTMSFDRLSIAWRIDKHIGTLARLAPVLMPLLFLISAAAFLTFVIAMAVLSILTYSSSMTAFDQSLGPLIVLVCLGFAYLMVFTWHCVGVLFRHHKSAIDEIYLGVPDLELRL